jgi:transposase-like protein
VTARRYSDADRERARELRTTMSVSQVAAEIGCTKMTVLRWTSESTATMERASRRRARERLTPEQMEERNARRRRRVASGGLGHCACGAPLGCRRSVTCAECTRRATAEESRDRAQRLVDAWCAGFSRRACADAAGVSVGAVSVMMADLRSIGVPVPRRRPAGRGGGWAWVDVVPEPSPSVPLGWRKSAADLAASRR